MRHRFIKNASGSVAPVFAIGITFIAIALGVGLDYSAMAQRQTELQNAADSLVLSAALSGETKPKKIEKYIKKAAKAQLDGDYTMTVSFSGDIVNIDVTQDFPLTFLGGFMPEGRKTRNITAKTAAPIAGHAPIDMALVIDTTESMSGDRIDALKTAAADLLDMLDEADETRRGDGVRASVVPFADYVRIDPSLRNRNWLQLPPEEVVTWDTIDWNASTNCRLESVEERETEVCDNTVMHTRSEVIPWIGCMGSRPNGMHLVPEFAASRMRGIAMHGRCRDDYNTIMPLTTDLRAVEDHIDAFETTGQTYIPAGLIWGWRTLDPAEPFTEAAERPDSRKVLVLMSDGSNTTSMRGTKPDSDAVYHWGLEGPDGEVDPEASKAAADALTLDMCARVKDDKIRLITIAFQIEDESTRSLLRDCATGGFDYYEVEEIEALAEAFKTIGRSVKNVRLLE